MNMPPSLLAFNEADGAVIDAILSADVGLTAGREKYRHSLAVGEFGESVARPAHIDRSAFGNFVGNVVGVCSEEEVSRFDAGADIAMMKGLHSIRDRAVRVFPRKTMSLLYLAVPAQRSVPGTLSGACPYAASAGPRLTVVSQASRQRPVIRALKSRHAVYLSYRVEKVKP